jgi:hypothetical protein
MHKPLVLIVTIAMASALAAPSFASAKKRTDGSGGGNVRPKYDLVKAKGAKIIDGGNGGPAKINGAGKPSISSGGGMKH